MQDLDEDVRGSAWSTEAPEGVEVARLRCQLHALIAAASGPVPAELICAGLRKNESIPKTEKNLAAAEECLTEDIPARADFKSPEFRAVLIGLSYHQVRMAKLLHVSLVRGFSETAIGSHLSLSWTTAASLLSALITLNISECDLRQTDLQPSLSECGHVAEHHCKLSGPATGGRNANDPLHHHEAATGQRRWQATTEACPPLHRSCAVARENGAHVVPLCQTVVHAVAE